MRQLVGVLGEREPRTETSFGIRQVRGSERMRQLVGVLGEREPKTETSFGIRHAREVHGRANLLASWANASQTPTHWEESRLRLEEDEALVERLRGLGYID